MLLIRVYIPEEVQIEITGSSFALNYPNYLSFKSINYYNNIFENFNYGLSNQLFSSVGIKSDSTIYNTYSFFTLLILMAIFHISIYFLLLVLSKCRADWKWFRLIKIFKWAVNKLLIIMTFGYYIRTILEMIQYLLISTIYEIYEFHTAESLQIVSLLFSFLVLLLIVVLKALMLYLYNNWNIKYKIDMESLSNLKFIILLWWFWSLGFILLHITQTSAIQRYSSSFNYYGIIYEYVKEVIVHQIYLIMLC